MTSADRGARCDPRGMPDDHVLAVYRTRRQTEVPSAAAKPQPGPNYVIRSNLSCRQCARLDAEATPDRQIPTKRSHLNRNQQIGPRIVITITIEVVSQGVRWRVGRVPALSIDLTNQSRLHGFRDFVGGRDVNSHPVSRRSSRRRSVDVRG